MGQGEVLPRYPAHACRISQQNVSKRRYRNEIDQRETAYRYGIYGVRKERGKRNNGNYKYGKRDLEKRNEPLFFLPWRALSTVFLSLTGDHLSKRASSGTVLVAVLSLLLHRSFKLI